VAAGQALRGALPAALFQLRELQHLDLSNNELGPGPIMPFAALTRLVFLDLSLNRLVGDLAPFTSLTALQVLKVAENAFSGSVPDLSSLESLETLHVHRNGFSGVLPPRWPPALDSCILAVQASASERSCFKCPLPSGLPPACTATPVFAVSCSSECDVSHDDSATRNYVFAFAHVRNGSLVPSFSLRRDADARFANDAVSAPLTIDVYALPLATLLKQHTADGSLGCVVAKFNDTAPIVRKLFQIAIVVRNNDLRRRFRIVSAELTEFRANAAVETAVVDILRRVNGSQLADDAFGSATPPPLAIDDAETVDRINVDASHANAGFTHLGATFGDAFVFSAGPFSSFRIKSLKIESSMVPVANKRLKTTTLRASAATTTATTTTTTTTQTPSPTPTPTTPSPSPTTTTTTTTTTTATTTTTTTTTTNPPSSSQHGSFLLWCAVAVAAVVLWLRAKLKR
jgi:cell division septation protein DedD